MRNLIERTRRWADSRGIYDGSTLENQALRMVAEVGEVADDIAKGKDPAMEIGDVIVTVINTAHMAGLDIEDCLRMALEKIEGRETVMVNGTAVKVEDLK